MHFIAAHDLMTFAYRDVLDFWFEPPDAPGHGTPRKVWFSKDPGFDAEVRDRFAGLHARAARGGLADWENSPESLLALIVTLDQFPRNMYRGSPAAFSTDASALAAARTMVERGWDRDLLPAMRMFVYLPFEHSELLADQDECMRLMKRLGEDARFADLPKWAEKHREVVRRFGRFPHRNAILGRASTPAEVEFLSQPGSSF